MSDDIVELTAKHTYGTWRAQRGWKPIHVTRAEGCSSGTRPASATSTCPRSSSARTSATRTRPSSTPSARRRSELAFISPAHTCDVRAKLAQKLLEVMPKGLDKFFFATSGTEANEAAFKIARLYTGKHKIIARYTSYHGSTAGSVAATGDFRRWFVEPAGKIPGVVFGPEVQLLPLPARPEPPRVRRRVRRLPRLHDRPRGERRGDHRRADRRHQRRPRPAGRVPAEARRARARSAACCSSPTR